MSEPAAATHRVGWVFLSLYMLAFLSTSLLFLAPLLVTLALKVNSLVGIERAPNSLALVAGVGALLAMVGNPFFGRMSDRTSSRLGMRRPWMIIGLLGGSAGILVVALAPTVPVVLLAASMVYGMALFVVAVASGFNGFLVGMAVAGLGFGVYVAVDLALVVDVLPSPDNAAKDLGVFNIAGALPYSIAPAIGPAILAIGRGSYGVLFAVAGACAVLSAVAIVPVRRVR